ncbi:MAG: glycerol-3-phosphate 1-O-acyltransferase PlsY [Candidatus Omnitrophica bacterium]|nr:glycerol-3-phosphate 1-O-acyltransferase PlsY [Candidatus Omnitrophota bacterium]
MPFFLILCWGIAGYLSGSLVWGYWISKYFYGIDIRTKGSGNIGATNVFRVLGPVPGIFTFILDVFKGALPIILLKMAYGTNTEEYLLISTGIATILGSKFSIFLRGKGGKAVNCSFGVILGILPKEAIISFFIWLFIFLSTGYVSLASMTAATALPFLTYFLQKNLIFTVATTVISTVIIVAHKENIKRLVSGKENRFMLWKK